jgi:type IV secretion system effector X-Tfes-like protein
MSTLSSQAQAVVVAFGQQPGVTQDQINNLQAVISASPALIDQINDAVAQGHLRQIMPLTNPHAGGEYDGQNKAMRLPLSALTTPPSGAAPFNSGEVTFVLGHELQHGFNHAATVQAYRDFNNEATQMAQSQSGVHDYTAATGKLISANRRDEASAEISGWNAIASAVKSANPNATLADIYNQEPGRMRDFIDRVGSHPSYTYTLKPNLSINPDLTLSATPANVEAMGQNYFDKPPISPGGLGHHGNSDYANYYGAYAVGVAAQLERQHNPPTQGGAMPQMTIDLSHSGLTEKLMEENGINLGANAQPQPYYDSSVQPPVLHHFDHTATTHAHVPIAAQEAESRDASTLKTVEVESSRHHPDQPNHPDHALHRQIRAGVEQLSSKNDRAWDETSERMTASLVLLAKQNGLERVDHVVLSEQRGNSQKGENVFLIQGQLADPAHTRAMMKTNDAISTPEADSYRNLEALNQQKAQEQVQQPAREQQQEAQRRTMTM